MPKNNENTNEDPRPENDGKGDKGPIVKGGPNSKTATQPSKELDTRRIS